MRLLSLNAGILACLPLACLGDPDIQARFEKSLKDAKSISNVEIEILDTLWMPHGIGTNEAPFSRTFQYSYIASGLKYRAECKLISGTQTNLAKLAKSAFDGNAYSSYDADNHSATRRKENAPGDRSQSPLNPLIAPFMFLTRNSEECLQCVLRLTDIVSPYWTNEVILPSGRRSEGLLETSLAGLPINKQPTAWRIAIDEAGDSFTPKTISRRSGVAGPEAVYRLLNYTNLGAYSFPTRIEWAHIAHSLTSPPTLHATGLVTVISARIPDLIADSVFRLNDEEKSAAVIWDWDQRNFVKSAQGNSNSNSNGQTRTKIYDESLDGSKQIADALIIARKDRKRVLLQFGANWCSWCQKLHKLFQTDKRVAKELERNYVIVMIDMNNGHNKDVNKKYGNPTRFGLPAIVVLDTDGKQLTTQNTGDLEEGDHHSPEKVTAFLKESSPTR
jgi:thiol-disulfide isomerase/thioredoxin